MRIEACLIKARSLAASLSYRVATRRHCLILLKNRSIKFRARYRYGLKQIGSLRLRFGGILAHAPCWRASSLIQSASYPRSASSIGAINSEPAFPESPPNRTCGGYARIDQMTLAV